jgi:hypothetical protein
LAGGCDLDSRILPAQEGSCVRKTSPIKPRMKSRG